MMSEETPVQPKAHPRHPAPALFLQTYLLLGCMMLLWSGSKVHKLFLLLGSHTQGWPGALIPLLFWDVLIALLLLWCAMGWFAFVGRDGWPRRIGLISVGSIALLGMLLGAIEHRFFTVTYTLISWDMLSYGVRQLVMLSDLILSQLNWMTGILLLLPLGVLWLPHWFVSRPRIAEWLEAQEGEMWCSFRGLRWATGLWCLLWLLHPALISKELKPLQRNFLVHWAQGVQLAGRRKARKPGVKIAIDRSKMLFDAQRLRFLPTDKMRRPNVVLIVLESMRWRSTTMAKPKLKTTPFLDKLAKRSLLVEDMSAVVPHTSKALVAIFCGIYPKITMEVVEAEVGGIPARCLPTLLKSLGYKTAIFHPATLRFENYDQLSENIGFGFIRGMEHLSSFGFFRTNYFGYEDKIMLKPSLKWLDQTLPRKRPFFLAYHTLTSHHGYKTPPSFPMRRFTDQPGELNQYLNALRYTDDFLAELFAAFRKRGMMKNTVFVFVADHGEAFGEHKKFQHDNGMWQEILRIPSMIYAPSLWPKGRKIKGPRQQIDIVPTIADILGVKVTGGRLSGKSLLRPVSADRRMFMSCWYERFCMAMREGNRKYIYSYKRREHQLYHLANDPMEAKNLADVQKRRDDVLRAEKALVRWRKRVNDVYNTPDPLRLKQSIQRKAPDVDIAYNVSLGEWLQLVGVRLPKGQIKPNQVIDLTYVFRCVKRVPKGWQMFYHLSQDTPPRHMNKDHSPVGGRYPLQQWRVGEYILDHHRFRVPVTFVPGSNAAMSIGLWHDKHGRAKLSHFKGDRRAAKRHSIPISLGKLGPLVPKADGQPPVARPHNARIGNMLRLIGVNIHTPRWTPGKALDMTVVFQVLRPIGKGWRLFMHVDQVKPKQFLNARRFVINKIKPLWQWKTREFVQARLRVHLSPAYFRKGSTLQVWTGLWAQGQPRVKVVCEDQDRCSDGKGRLLVHEKVLK